LLGKDSDPCHHPDLDVSTNNHSQPLLRREGILFVGLLIAGAVPLPAAVFLVGKAVFGAYGGDGLADFYAALNGKLAAADWVAWFLVLSPYLAVQCVRLMARLWRMAGETASNH
jgi:hypothetical protein